MTFELLGNKKQMTQPPKPGLAWNASPTLLVVVGLKYVLSADLERKFVQTWMLEKVT